MDAICVAASRRSTLDARPLRTITTDATGRCQCMPASMDNASGSPTESSDMSPSLSPSCSALLPSHATLLTINRTRTAGPFDCVIPRSSRVPMLNRRGPSSCRPMQGSASSRPSLYPLFASPTSSTACLPRSLSYRVPRVPSGPPPSLSVYRPASMRGGTDIVQCDSSLASKARPRLWRPLLSPSHPLRLAATTRTHHQTSADSPPPPGL